MLLLLDNGEVASLGRGVYGALGHGDERDRRQLTLMAIFQNVGKDGVDLA